MSQLSKPQRRRAVLRRDLTRYAIDLVGREGLSALQARRLAGLAGCSVGAIYNVFPDLDDLILTANADTLERVAGHERAALAALPPCATPAERLLALALAYVEFAHANEMAWRALFEYRVSTHKAYPDWYAAIQAEAFATIEKVIVGAEGRPSLAGEEAGRDVAMVARTLWAAVHGIVLTGMDSRQGQHSRAEIEAQVRLLVLAAARGLRSGLT